MARFYVGQPVMCVKDKEWWDTAPGTCLEVPCPVLGQRYVVDNYAIGVFDHLGDAMMYLKEMRCAGIYSETGFAPITDEQVREIITEATRIPTKVTEKV